MAEWTVESNGKVVYKGTLAVQAAKTYLYHIHAVGTQTKEVTLRKNGATYWERKMNKYNIYHVDRDNVTIEEPRAGYYFAVEEYIGGPFSSKELAEERLEDYLNNNEENND